MFGYLLSMCIGYMLLLRSVKMARPPSQRQQLVSSSERHHIGNTSTSFSWSLMTLVTTLSRHSVRRICADTDRKAARLGPPVLPIQVRGSSGPFTPRTPLTPEVYLTGAAPARAPRAHEGADPGGPGTPNPPRGCRSPSGWAPPRAGPADKAPRGRTAPVLPGAGGRHLGGRRGRRWDRPGPPPPRSRPGSGPGPPRRGCPAGSAAGSGRFRQDEEAPALGAGHLQPPLRQAPRQPHRRLPLRYQPALDLHAGGDLGQRGGHRSVSPLPPPPSPGAAGGSPRVAGLRAGAGAEGAGGRRWWPGGSPVGELRGGGWPGRATRGRVSVRRPAKAPGGGGGGRVDSAQRDGTPLVLSPRRNPLREAQLGRRGLIKSCESVLLLPGALSHAMFELRLPRL